jgi:hypothetical protein
MARRSATRRRPAIHTTPRIDVVQSNKEAPTGGGLAALLERVREGCSSGTKPLGRFSSGFSSPGKSFHPQPNHGELHHPLAAAR